MLMLWPICGHCEVVIILVPISSMFVLMPVSEMPQRWLVLLWSCGCGWLVNAYRCVSGLGVVWSLKDEVCQRWRGDTKRSLRVVYWVCHYRVCLWGRETEIEGDRETELNPVPIYSSWNWPHFFFLDFLDLLHRFSFLLVRCMFQPLCSIFYSYLKMNSPKKSEMRSLPFENHCSNCFHPSWTLTLPSWRQTFEYLTRTSEQDRMTFKTTLPSRSCRGCQREGGGKGCVGSWGCVVCARRWHTRTHTFWLRFCCCWKGFGRSCSLLLTLESHLSDWILDTVGLNVMSHLSYLERVHFNKTSHGSHSLIEHNYLSRSKTDAPGWNQCPKVAS